MDAERVRADVAALAEAVAGWNGGPWDPVVVEARQLLATARARLLQADVYGAAIKRK